MSERKRIFISYKRKVEPDDGVAERIAAALRPKYTVFIDKEMLTGTRWAEKIEEELRKSDFLITLLSAESVHSEMVRGEIEKAHDLADQPDGRPAILPVRLAYQEPFRYPLSAWLNPINWSVWGGPEDTLRIIEELQRAITGGELPIDVPARKNGFLEEEKVAGTPQPLPHAQPAALERPDGTMRAESAFYIERPTDLVALETIAGNGVTLVIKAPRQMGKSSLLVRTMEAAAKAGKSVAFLDFQLFGKDALADPELFFRQFCSLLSDELDLDDRTEECWSQPLGNSQRCTRYLTRYLLREVAGQVYLAMDEVDALFNSSFRSEFFSMLRVWHGKRARPGKTWRRLDLALVTSTEPYQFVEDLTRSPFNVGEILELKDFTLDDAAALNARHGSPLSEADLEKLMDLLEGHPFLLRRALYLVATRRFSFSDLVGTAAEDHGPFGDHLRYHLFRMYDKRDLVEGLAGVLDHHRCHDERVFWRLRGAGLVRRTEGEELPRNELYADYFRERLDV